MPDRIVIIGAGGHALVLIDTLRLNQTVELIGVVDAQWTKLGLAWQGLPVLGGDDAIPLSIEKGATHFVLAIGSAAATRLREKLFQAAIGTGLRPFTIIHPTAIVSPSAAIGAGSQLLAGCVVNAFADLGSNVIVNTRSVVEHEARIGAHTHIATGALVCGAAQIGTRSHIGAGAILRQGILVDSDSTVGAGAVVTKNVASGLTVVGNPARELSPSHD